MNSDTNNAIELLKQLVSIPSVFPNEAEVSAFIGAKLEGMGFRVEQVLTAGGRPNLVATFGESPSYLGFYGHMDTVPPAKDYAANPFEVRLEGDRLSGLGVCDMKGGLSCILTAAAWAVQEKLPLKLIFGVDEEDISQGAHDLVDSGLLSDVAYLIVAESGQVRDFEQAFSVCLGRKGRIVFEAEVAGKIAHAAEAARGINAVEKAALLIGALSQYQFPPHPELGRSSLVVQEISAQSDSFSVPDSCRFSFSLLSTPGLGSEDVSRIVAEMATGLGVSVKLRTRERLTPYGEAYETDLQHPFYRLLKEQVIDPAGVTPIYTASVADENVFAHRLRIPVLTMGLIGAGDHTAGEWASLASFGRLIEAYRQAIRLWGRVS